MSKHIRICCTILATMGAIHTAHAADGNTRLYYACSKDKDCALVKPACGNWMPINIQYKAAVQKQENERAKTMDCASKAPDPSLVASATCHYGTCSIKMERTEKGEEQ